MNCTRQSFCTLATWCSHTVNGILFGSSVLIFFKDFCHLGSSRNTVHGTFVVISLHCGVINDDNLRRTVAGLDITSAQLLNCLCLTCGGDVCSVRMWGLFVAWAKRAVFRLGMRCWSRHRFEY